MLPSTPHHHHHPTQPFHAPYPQGTTAPPTPPGSSRGALGGNPCARFLPMAPPSTPPFPPNPPTPANTQAMAAAAVVAPLPSLLALPAPQVLPPPHHQAVCAAAERGDVEALATLVAQDPSLLQARDDYNRTPLLWVRLGWMRGR